MIDRARSRRGGKPRGKRMFEQTYRTQGGLCLLCRRFFPMEKMTRDHIVPLSRGGSPDWGNIGLTCEPCNARKDSRPLRLLL